MADDPKDAAGPGRPKRTPPTIDLAPADVVTSTASQAASPDAPTTNDETAAAAPMHEEPAADHGDVPADAGTPEADTL